MSIWGKRVDAWVDQDNRKGLTLLWQIGLVLLAGVAAVGVVALLDL